MAVGRFSTGRDKKYSATSSAWAWRCNTISRMFYSLAQYGRTSPNAAKGGSRGVPVTFFLFENPHTESRERHQNFGNLPGRGDPALSKT